MLPFAASQEGGYLIMSQQDKEIMSCQTTLVTGSSFQEIEYVHSLMVYVCIWGHRIKCSYDGEGLQNMVLHKGLRPDPIMIFPSKGRSSHFNSPLCQWFLPTSSLWSWYGCQLHWVRVLRSPSRAVRIRGLLLLYNFQHSYQPSPWITVRALMCRCTGFSQCASAKGGPTP